MSYQYGSDFYDFVDVSSGRSAPLFLSCLDLGYIPETILDVGCGRGIWLKAWKNRGARVLGLDGAYVDRSSLVIEQDEFIPIDISKPFDLKCRFDLVQCLEVGEHIPEKNADTLVSNLTRHADVVLFSSGSPGQGGEHHVNEQPIAYWAKKFHDRGFSSFDYPRAAVQDMKEIEPWYRYNAILYANINGQAKLSSTVKEYLVPKGGIFRVYASFSWQLRCRIVRILPFSLVMFLAKIKHRATV